MKTTPLAAVLTAPTNSQQARVRLTIAHEETYAGGGEFGTTTGDGSQRV